MRVALIQVSYGDDESVAERVTRVADLVRAQRGADLVLLPELWAAGGFSYRDWEERAEPLEGPTGSAMSAAARDAGVLLHAGSIVERLEAPGPDGQWLSNTSLVYGPDGERLAHYRKIHRFGFAAGEPTLMVAGDDPTVTVDVAGARLGLTTCYDLRFPELYRTQLDSGTTVFVVPAAWPLARVGHWTLLGRARAVENQAWLLACNTAGTHAGHEMGGHSQIVDPTGVVVAEAGIGEEIVRADIDLDLAARWRSQFPVNADRRINPPAAPPTRGEDNDRLAARREALAAALGALTAHELADDARVAGLATAPGFRPSAANERGGDTATGVLAASRARRRADLAELLAVAPPAARGEAAALADWLTAIREDLVHPMTGESMSLLDWVNRGGPVDVALAAAR
jgi:predicted amidohydrolase